jgi:MFS family permease
MKLAAIMLVAALGPAAFLGSRLVVTLQALELGAGPVTVGVLTALYGLLPIFLGQLTGRITDRIGVGLPLFVWGSMFFVAQIIPWLHISLVTLAVSALLTGFAFMGNMVSTNQAVAGVSSSEGRTGNFGWMTAANALGSALGPVAAGFAIDRIGHRDAFLVVSLIPALSLVVVALVASGLPRPSGVPAAARMPAREIWRSPRLRLTLALAAFIPVTVDLFFFIVPLVGARIQLPASTTGSILGLCAGVALVARILLPWLMRAVSEWAAVSACFVMIGAGFVMLPAAQSAAPLFGISFLLGVGGGIGPPLLLSLLYGAAPAGRKGELLGVRAALVSSLSGVTPMLAGGLGALAGMTPVLLATGIALLFGARVAWRVRSSYTAKISS